MRGVIRLLAVLASFVELCITFFSATPKTVALKRSNMTCSCINHLRVAWVAATLSKERDVTKLLVEERDKYT